METNANNVLINVAVLVILMQDIKESKHSPQL